MLALGLPAFAQYAGPAILSRGEAPAAMSAQTVDFNLSLALTANYTDGLVGVTAPDAQGQLAGSTAFGGGASLGISGSHSWKHTHIGLNYSGAYTDYSSGIYQGLSFGLSHQFSRHISFSLRESAGMFTEFPPSTVSLNSSVPFDPSQSFIPTTDFYDNRTIYSTTQANLTIQASTRLSFSLGGGYFTNLRSSPGLYSATGEVASGDAQYRLSRRTTIGASYSFSHYGYSHSLGGADIHSADLGASMRLNRWTEFSMFAGASRVESNFQQTVPIDPAILAILCPATYTGVCPVTAGSVISHNVFWGPNFGARFSRSFRRGVAYVSAGEYITPGNGLFLTSRAAQASVGYGYSGLRKWSLSVGASYTTALSIGNAEGGYGQYGGSYGMSRQIVKSLSFVSGFYAMKYQSNSFAGYNRLIYSASIGIGFSTGNIPVRFF